MAKPTSIFFEKQILLHDYLEGWGLEDHFKKMQEAFVDQNEPALAMAAHRAWEALPDKPAIRTSGFFALTDIAEQIFGIDNDE